MESGAMSHGRRGARQKGRKVPDGDCRLQTVNRLVLVAVNCGKSSDHRRGVDGRGTGRAATRCLAQFHTVVRVQTTREERREEPSTQESTILRLDGGFCLSWEFSA